MTPAASKASASADSPADDGRRAQILDAAIDHLSRGFAQASIHRIAKAADVSVGLIAYHFGSKSGLFQAVRDHVVALALTVMVPKIEQAESARDKLRALITSNLEFMAAHPTELSALVELIRHDIISGSPEPGIPQGVRDIDTLLRHGQDTGEFGTFDTLTMAATIRSAIDQVPLVLTYRPDLDLAAFGAELADTFDTAVSAAGEHSKNG